MLLDHRIQWNKAEFIHEEENRSTVKESVFNRIEQFLGQSSLCELLWLPLLQDRK
jgi:hypothetical protein